MPDARIAALVTITSVVLFGTIYSVANNTYLDTSNPLLTHLPHPLHSTHYFASKANPLNVYYIKRIWGWTILAFLAHFLTSPRVVRTKERFFQFLAATAFWIGFTTWFFGPAVFDRLVASTGGECVVSLPSGAMFNVPNEYCYTKSTISAVTHPALFPASLLLPDDSWHTRPRLRRGHDVSGHIFLLTMSTLFLVDQLRTSFGSSSNGSTESARLQWTPYHKWAVVLNLTVIATSLFAMYTTSVYFHTPFEKLTGYLLGVAGFAVTQLPVFQPTPEAAVITNREDDVKEKADIARSI
ncbi:hypothetical protein WOLCODRAFT_76013 [Wolfiporia cocos MD-104 SS10]|uniref:Inositol phospholipid synthesis and fat-storage-inducing TM-domain-containing protein n=1 Tax=Wolfiporia cocos (strain MD-104) TaxID=742152 RepID=A0A2H3JNQ5_WOLCO|nr:hypothetical protein WOLCODRAFT_76013 [Wolfiporia cocos MD-104 SS10]